MASRLSFGAFSIAVPTNIINLKNPPPFQGLRGVEDEFNFL